MVTVVHVDDIFAVGFKAGCDQFCEYLNRSDQQYGRAAVVCWLSFFEGLGYWYFDDFATRFR